MISKRSITFLGIAGLALLLCVASWDVTAEDGGSGAGDLMTPTGTWAGTNTEGHATIGTITPLGLDNKTFALHFEDTWDPTGGGTSPGVRKTSLIGQMVRTGLNTCDVTVVGYVSGPGGAPDETVVHFVNVVSGTFVQVDNDTIEGSYTSAAYAPDQDPFGDEPPALGCLSISGTWNRIAVVPPCDPL